MPPAVRAVATVDCMLVVRLHWILAWLEQFLHFLEFLVKDKAMGCLKSLMFTSLLYYLVSYTAF